MKNLVIKKGCLILVDETEREEFVMSLGMVVGCLYTSADANDKLHRPLNAEICRRIAEQVKDSVQFQEWLLG